MGLSYAAGPVGIVESGYELTVMITGDAPPFRLTACPHDEIGFFCPDDKM
jgi:hypothetical protein